MSEQISLSKTYKFTGVAAGYVYKRYQDYKGEWNLMNVSPEEVQVSLIVKPIEKGVRVTLKTWEARYLDANGEIEKDFSPLIIKQDLILSSRYAFTHKTWKDNSNFPWEGVDLESSEKCYGIPWGMINLSLRFHVAHEGTVFADLYFKKYYKWNREYSAEAEGFHFVPDDQKLVAEFLAEIKSLEEKMKEH